MIALFALLLSASPADSDRHPISLFAGIDAYYSLLQSDRAGELDKDGFQISTKLLANLRLEKMSLDLGVGWFLNQMEKAGANPPVVGEKIRTRAFLTELSGRYRWNHFELGPVFQILAGPNVSFSTIDSAEKINFLIGPTFVYRWDFRFPIRLQVQTLTDLSIPDRQIWLIGGGLQVGWNFGQSSRDDHFELSRSEKESGQQRISFNSDVIFFDVNSAQIRPESQAKLIELGDFLAKNHSLWAKLEVIGHTDHLGSYEYNLDLSRRRAEAVREILVAGGVPPADVASVGKSFSEPRMLGDSDEARRQNRRVELKFTSQKNLSTIRKKVRDLMLDESP